MSYFSGTLSIFLAVAEARPLSTEPPLTASPIFINGSKVMMSVLPKTFRRRVIMSVDVTDAH